MTTFLTVLVVLAMLSVVGVLAAGLIGLARNGDDGAGRERSNKLMQWRVGLQGAALVLFVLLLSLLNSTR